MEQGLRTFLEGMLEGIDDLPEPRESLIEKTPARVAAAFIGDLAAGYEEEPASHLEPIALSGARGPVVLRGVRFTSLCAHHLLPFRGEAHVGFVPEERHVGLGNIARMIDSMTRRLALQESLTAEIASRIDEALQPRSVVVVLEAEHLCLSVRGARKTGHRLTTVERRGPPDPDLERAMAGG
jgi:GTP cyclohydrolase I